jgi:transcriptional regulator with XRE-family HTH domain
MMGEKRAETVGARALKVREEQGLGQKEIAAALGVSLRAWAKMERDEGTPSGETLLLFEKIGINPGWVLTGLGPKNLQSWRDGDADAELFIRIGAMVEDVYRSQAMDIPARGVAKTAQAIFSEITRDLGERPTPDEIDALVAFHAARLRRRNSEAMSEPGAGKRSAS